MYVPEYVYTYECMSLCVFMYERWLLVDVGRYVDGCVCLGLQCVWVGLDESICFRFDVRVLSDPHSVNRYLRT